MQWQKQQRQKKHSGLKTKKMKKGNFLKFRSTSSLKGEYPAGSSKREKLVVCRRAKDYQIVNGQLHYFGHLKGSKQVGERSNKIGMYSYT